MPDDFTPEEVELYNFLINGFEIECDVTQVYRVLDDPLEMFIVCYVYELGRTQKSLEPILNLSKMQLYTIIKKIKAKLYQHYKQRRMIADKM
jgi:DNA-directed RNA polymerase specialized sigma subunit